MLYLALDHRVEVLQLVVLANVLAAWRWGAGPERACALVMLLMALAGQVYHSVVGPTYVLHRIDWVYFTIDAAAVAVLLTIAVLANRIYPLWIGLLQLIAFGAHFARLAEDQITPLAYAIMFFLPSWFQALAVSLGIWLHRRRYRRYGRYRSWRTSSLHSWVSGRWPWLGN